jgi:hypothetical protein
MRGFSILEWISQVAELAGHVKPAEFETELKLAALAGLEVVERPAIRGIRAGVPIKA